MHARVAAGATGTIGQATLRFGDVRVPQAVARDAFRGERLADYQARLLRGDTTLERGDHAVF